MVKHYRVIKNNFLWEEGAILKADGRGYVPIEDVWDATEHNGEEYISTSIVENNPEWFQRVYSLNLLSKTVYKTKEEMKEYLKGTVTE